MTAGRAEGKERKECGGTRFLQKAGFPRTPSGKNFYQAGGSPAERGIIATKQMTKQSPKVGIQ